MASITMYGNTRFNWKPMLEHISARNADEMHAKSTSVQLLFGITVVRYEGRGLSYDESLPSVPSSGTIDKMSKGVFWYDYKMSDLSLKASDLKKVAETKGKADDIALFKGLLDGNDFFSGANRADVFRGYDGNDRLDGGWGSDRLFGDRGNDKIYGSVGNDRLFGGAGNDQVHGDWGHDTLAGGAGRDLLRDEYGGNDRLIGQAGNDRLFAGEGNDVLVGGTGSDLLNGEAGNDRLIGGDGFDKLNGGDGNDYLNGGAGGDRLNGGDGVDVLVGGTGADRFEYSNVSDTGTTAATRDKIVDFTAGSDTIDISALSGAAFTFLNAEGSAFNGVAGELRWYVEGASVILEGDTNGNGSGNFQIELQNTSTIAQDDIIL